MILRFHGIKIWMYAGRLTTLIVPIPLNGCKKCIHFSALTETASISSIRELLVGDVTLRNDQEVCIVVCKDFQNKRIGRRCILKMIELAKEKRMDQITAEIYPFNTQSQKMFLSIGFIKTGEETYTYQLS